MPKKSTAKKTGATKKSSQTKAGKGTKKGATKKAAKRESDAKKGAQKKAPQSEGQRPPRGSKNGNMVALAISLLAKPQTREQVLVQMAKTFPDVDAGKLKNRLQRLFWAIRSGAESNRAALELKELDGDRFQIVEKGASKKGAKKKVTKAA